MTEPTPRPWQKVHTAISGLMSITDADGRFIATIHEPAASLLVRSVNAHDALVAALSDLLACAEQVGWDARDYVYQLDRARAALALAEKSDG